MVNPHMQAPNAKNSASNFTPIGVALFIKGFPSVSALMAGDDSRKPEHSRGRQLQTSPAIAKLPARC